MTKTAHLRRMAVSLGVVALLAFSPAQAQNFAPAVIVNDTIITNYDVDQRARLMAAAGGGASVASMQDAALEALIADALKTGAARREGISPSGEDIRAGLAEIARQNGSSPDELIAYFQSRGVSREALEAQVGAEVAWRTYVQRQFAGRGTVTESEVDTAVQRGLGQSPNAAPQYSLKQVVVGVSPNALQGDADAALSLARAARAQITTTDACSGIDNFLAINGTQGAYLPISGDIGSMRLDQMPPPVRNAVASLSPGAASEPVRSNDGFHIIGVCDVTGGGGIDRERAREAVLDERLNRYSRSLLQDLRRQAVIERR